MHDILKKHINIFFLIALTCSLIAGNTAIADSVGMVPEPGNHIPKKEKNRRQNKIPDLLKYVNTLQGTNSKFSHSHGNDYPAVALPRAMNF